jgi:hypothetical protein
MDKLAKIKKLADAMYYAAQYLTTDASRLHKAMDEYRQFIIHEWREEPVSEQNLSNVERTVKNWKEEPVSEDLEKIAELYTLDDSMKPWRNLTKEAFISGAKWQINKMMEDATEATVHIDAGGYPYIPQLELYDYDKDVPLAKEGDKYKVVLIEDGQL